MKVVREHIEFKQPGDGDSYEKMGIGSHRPIEIGDRLEALENIYHSTISIDGIITSLSEEPNDLLVLFKGDKFGIYREYPQSDSFKGMIDETKQNHFYNDRMNLTAEDLNWMIDNMHLFKRINK